MSRSFPKLRSIALGVGGAACILTASTAIAQGTSLPAAGFGEALPDSELADMRGKFINRDNISFFGITLLTSWQDAQGITTNARLVFNVDFLNRSADGKPIPSLMIGWSREGDPAMDVTDTHAGYIPLVTATPVVPAGGLGTHQGAAQANIVAGRNNVTRNGMQIAIVPSSAMSGFSTEGLQSIDTATQFAFADGDQLQFLLSQNNVGIAMIGGDGLDSSLQSLGGDMGQMLQHNFLNTSGNNLFNSASIVLAADNFARFDGIKVENALSAMKGHGY